MKIHNFEEENEWLNFRRAKITGSKISGLITKRGTGKKIGYYELIAERLGLPPTDESAMERGHELEGEAIDILSEKIGKEISHEKIMWTREDDEDIAISPDGVIGDDEVVEVKCLSSARHIEALLTNKIPSEYWEQSLQYFVVNDNLKKLYFVFYDPRLQFSSHFFLEIKREDVEEEVKELLEYERNLNKEIKDIALKLSF